MVPMLTCGLLRSNFAFATAGPPQDCCRPSILLIAWRFGWIWTGPTARTRWRRGCLPRHLVWGPGISRAGRSVGDDSSPTDRSGHSPLTSVFTGRLRLPAVRVRWRVLGSSFAVHLRDDLLG